MNWAPSTSVSSDVEINHNANNIQNFTLIQQQARKLADYYPLIPMAHILEQLHLFSDLPNYEEFVRRLFQNSVYTDMEHLVLLTRNTPDNKRKNDNDSNPIKKIKFEEAPHPEQYPFMAEILDLSNKMEGDAGSVDSSEPVLFKRVNLRKNNKISEDVVDLTAPEKFDASHPFEAQLENDLLGFILDNELRTNKVESKPKVSKLKDMSINNNNEVPSSSNNLPQKSIISLDQKLMKSMFEMFPDADPSFLKQFCNGRKFSEEEINDLCGKIIDLNDNYPKRRPKTPENEVIDFESVKDFLPDADPDYLRAKYDSFDGKVDLIRAFVNNSMELRGYPTLKDYERRQQLSAQSRQYTTEFNVKHFLKLFPNPFDYFNDPKRIIVIKPMDEHYLQLYFRNKFNQLPVRTINSTLIKCNSNVALVMQSLQKIDKINYLKSKRRPVEMPSNDNIPLLQELAFYDNEQSIAKYFEKIKLEEEIEIIAARTNGLMKTCSCCYDEEVLPKNIYNCENGCEFCHNCIKKSTEVVFGEGKLDFPCLHCSSAFSLRTLRKVIPANLFSKIARRKDLEEIKAAGLEDLEQCPFCDFASVPAVGDRIFSCLNPECMKDSCRLCHEASHIPLRCDEIEKDEETRARTYIENQMTEALLRKCWSCHRKFFKEEGCNKMTCVCGAKMCYLCKQPVKDYTHFNGQGGDKPNLCPLYSDTKQLHMDNVRMRAMQAKAEVGVINLKYDPTI